MCFVTASGLSWADLYLYHLFKDWMPLTGSGITIDDYPTLKGVYEKTEAIPALKEYMEKRPKYEF